MNDHAVRSITETCRSDRPGSHQLGCAQSLEGLRLRAALAALLDETDVLVQLLRLAVRHQYLQAQHSREGGGGWGGGPSMELRAAQDLLNQAALLPGTQVQTAEVAVGLLSTFSAARVSQGCRHEAGSHLLRRRRTKSCISSCLAGPESSGGLKRACKPDGRGANCRRAAPTEVCEGPGGSSNCYPRPARYLVFTAAEEPETTFCICPPPPFGFD